MTNRIPRLDPDGDDAVDTAQIAADAVTPDEVDSTDTPSDGEVLTFDSGTSRYKYTPAGGDASGESVTASGDGSTTFTLSHSHGLAPPNIGVIATTEDASTDFWISGGDSSSVDITYATAPPSGTDNLGYDVQAVAAGGTGGGDYDGTPQDVRNISSPAQGDMAYHDGSGSHTEGPAFYDSTQWVALLNGEVID